ncbi:Uncharacterised protein [Legionella wadsworthii]|uniref:Uncharacterized protein n=2 Tax=Legionella wadsworthii TaxID=28088 RepID=A0A378LQ00_9GAMM|nr:hypothetical protein [Legionella wadsworthii]STY29045.1 Uncharacterised protein [Legionella wadsworthii]
MEEKDIQVKCGACGVIFDRTNAQEVEVSRIKTSDEEEIIEKVYLCPYCAKHQS